ncbi:hypothetical protein [Hoeflea sp. TYP-13]|uniref:hypothetical protein n=1 Tax=Hoeflea sp. TYP-13 TaxID=3230023 RepID=UPI0034C5BCD6
MSGLNKTKLPQIGYVADNMTLRDEFALTALDPILSHVLEQGGIGDCTEAVATASYKIADAMLAARKKNP